MAAYELRNQKGSRTAISNRAASLAQFPLSMDSCSRIIRSIAAVASSASLFDHSTDAVFECHEAEEVDNEVLDSTDYISARSTRFQLAGSSPYKTFRLDSSFRSIDHASRPNSGILPFRLALLFQRS